MGDKGKERKEGAEGCCASLAMYATRDVYAKNRVDLLLSPSWKIREADGKRGGALAYCLKLLIGLRTDAAFPRCAASLSLSLSLPFLESPFFAIYFLFRLLYICFLSVALLHPPPTSTSYCRQDPPKRVLRLLVA